MKKYLYSGLGLLTALSLGFATSAAVSLPNIPSQSDVNAEAHPAGAVNLVSQRIGGPSPAVSPSPPPGSSVDGQTWMRGENIPWSTPTLVKDPQLGDYLAVFDRNYPTGLNIKQVRQMGEISNWSRRYIGIYGYGTQKHCVVVLVPICDTQHPTYPVSTARLKIGNQVFDLEGGNSQFVVDARLADALRQADAQSHKVLLRLTLAGGADTVTHPIGAPTVKAWPVIYQDASPVVAAPDVLPSSGGVAPSLSGLPSARLAQLPVVDGATWRINDDLPWSVPVLVKDEFDGNYVAVFDKDYQRNDWSAHESGLISDWSQKSIWLHFYEVASGTSYRTFGVEAVDIQVGDRRFHVTGHQNQLAVTDELAQALHNAGSAKVQVSFVNREGKTITHPIGHKTIQAWQTVYPISSVSPPAQTLPPSP